MSVVAGPPLSATVFGDRAARRSASEPGHDPRSTARPRTGILPPGHSLPRAPPSRRLRRPRPGQNGRPVASQCL